MHKIELLAPAGSFDSLCAAINAGADAVYLGGNRFGARAFADNLDQEQMLKAIDYAHLHGVNIYMTVNTLLKEDELFELYDFLYPYYCHGLDAVIVQDFGVLSFIRRNFPDLPIHASTQMTITGYYGAKILKELGVSRVVTARELSLQEIAKIHKEVEIEIESFIHGALCYGYSGQCLMSSLIGGRSGNRGRCAQPCRLPYDLKRERQVINSPKEKYLLSLKDMCTLDILPDLVDAGIYSLKIEGRMKSPRYTAGVVSIYRKYLDYYLKHGRDSYFVDAVDKELLLDLFDRGGFTAGFYNQHADRNIVALTAKPSFRKGNEDLYKFLDEEYIHAQPQLEIQGEISLKIDEPISLRFTRGDTSIQIDGLIPAEALKQPLTEEQVKKQLNKTGNSPFSFNKIKITISDDLFVPVQELNELRRQGLQKLEEQLLKSFNRSVLTERKSLIEMPEVFTDKKEVFLHVSLESIEGLDVILNHPDVSEIYLDSTGFHAHEWSVTVQRCHRAKVKKKCCLIMPHIFRTKADDYFRDNIQTLKDAGFDGIVVRTMEEVAFLKEYQINLPLIFDFTIYALNQEARAFLKKQGASRLTLPVELNGRELLQLGGQDTELLVYGHLPMMSSASCLTKTVETCNHKSELLFLKDRMGKEMPVKNHCIFCYNTIYNSSPLSLLGEAKFVSRLNPAGIRLSFTIESADEIEHILNSFAASFLHGQEKGNLKNFTRGHLKRGIE